MILKKIITIHDDGLTKKDYRKIVYYFLGMPIYTISVISEE